MVFGTINQQKEFTYSSYVWNTMRSWALFSHPQNADYDFGMSFEICNHLRILHDFWGLFEV
jgi:hypothetical protein